jgi:arylsulfatase A-like enzyme
MADDVGWMNVSSYGGDMMGVQTPNIDRIGREGFDSHRSMLNLVARPGGRLF